MNRYILSCAFALFAILPFCNVSAQDNVIDRVEWVVGDKAILRSDIEESIRYWLSTGRKFEGDPYCVVGEDLAIQQLFLHQAQGRCPDGLRYPADWLKGETGGVF